MIDDPYTIYEQAVRKLLALIDRKHTSYSDVLIQQQRLFENISHARKYGNSETLKAERSEIIHRLNDITLSSLGRSFNELFDNSDTSTNTASNKPAAIVESDTNTTPRRMFEYSGKSIDEMKLPSVSSYSETTRRIRSMPEPFMLFTENPPRFLILIAGIGLAFLILFTASNSPALNKLAERWRPPYNVNDSWKQDEVRITLAEGISDGGTLKIKWGIENTTQDTILLTPNLFKGVYATDTSGAYLPVAVDCPQGSDCLNLPLSLAANNSIEYTCNITIAATNSKQILVSSTDVLGHNRAAWQVFLPK